jgi:hypothetical protein
LGQAPGLDGNLDTLCAVITDVKTPVLVTAVLVALAVVVPALEHGQAAPAASRVIDRTVVCQMPGEGFPDVTRFITVSAAERPPAVSVANGPSFESRAAVRTRASGRVPTGAASLNREACVLTAKRVTVSARGLTAAPVRFVRVGGRRTALPRSYRCDVPTEVLVRVRARFARPTGWRLRPRHPTIPGPAIIEAKGTVETGSLMVATLAGVPVAYATVNNGRSKAALFVKRSRCSRQ